MGLGPFDLTGGPFLALYSVVLLLAGALSLWLPAFLRAPGRPGRVDNLDELAMLSGGPARLADAAIARLLAARLLVQQGKGSFRAATSAAGETAVERTILRAAQPATWPVIIRAVMPESQAIARRLAAKGLMLESGALFGLRLVAAAPLLLALGFGATKLIIGVERGKPAAFLAILLLVTVFLAIVRFGSINAATGEGTELLKRERERSDRLRRAPMRDEMGTSVALFGTAVLVGSEISAFHSMRSRNSDGGGDGGSSSSGGDSGDGGGGGCGGCGGCGG